MRTIRTGLFTSLDGIVDADDDWQFAYFDEELMRGMFAGFDGADDLLMGRVSYEGYARLRTEHPDSPVLPFLDARPKHVVSTTLADRDLDWEGATVIGLTVFPIVVGSGPRLFQNVPAKRIGLRLTDSRALASGALSLRYSPAEG